MGNLRQNYTDEEWEKMNEESKKDQVVRDVALTEVGKEIAAGKGTYEQKMTSFLYVACGNDIELFGRTVDLLSEIDKFKKELTKYENK